MTPERWRQVAAAFEAALGLKTEERPAFLSALSSEDPSLRVTVEYLLAQDAIQAGSARSAIGTATPAGKRIGGYQLLRAIGEGGMGVVFEAEQEHPRRIVALKIIKPGFASTELLRRFERESEVLARLQHPGIAQIYEAGAADTGFGPQPYFAMEFIHGVPLREYAELHPLSTRQRLDLMARVCDAVEHAHQRGIIHRDLKPGNILVDESGQPRILDFGVARVTDSDVQATRQTDVGQLIGTLAYMSPEQVTADPLDLDTRSDVYALGVILYELLADRLPYQLSQQLPEAVRAIREEDPTKLSSISRAYKGDVETIVAKALEKDKRRRYASAAALAIDIRRYLADEPIMARPASTTYQLRKFARRHKALVIATAVVFVVLAAGVVFSTAEAVRARRAEQTAEAVNDFLQNDLLAQASVSAQASRSTKPNPHLEVREALGRAASAIPGKFERQPEVEAGIRDTIGQAFNDLGLYKDARPQLARAVEAYRLALGSLNPKTLRTMDHLAQTDYRLSNLAQAEAIYRNAEERQRRVLGPESPDTLLSMHGLATVYYAQGRYADAEPLFRQVLAIRRRVLGPENDDTLSSLGNLAIVYAEQSKYADAEPLFRETFDTRRRVLGPEHPETLIAMDNLATICTLLGKYREAEALYLKALDIQRRIHGEDHPNTLDSMNNLAFFYNAQGKHVQAEELSSKTVEMAGSKLGPEDTKTLIYMSVLAASYELTGKYAQAEALNKQTLEIRRRKLGPEHPATFASLSDLASMYLRRRNYASAEIYARQALEGRRRILGAQNPRTMDSVADLAMAELSQGRATESEPLAREAVEFERKTRPEEWQRFNAESLLGASLAGQKNYAEAERLLRSGYEGMARRKDRLGALNLYHLEHAQEWVAQLYETSGKPEEAAAWHHKQP